MFHANVSHDGLPLVKRRVCQQLGTDIKKPTVKSVGLLWVYPGGP